MRGLRWVALTRGVSEVFSLITAVVLARLIAPAAFGQAAVALNSLATLRDPDVRGVRLCLGTAAEHRRDRPEQRDVHEHRRWRIAQPTGLRAHGTTVASTLRRRDGLPDRVDVADHVHGRPGRGLARHALAGARLSQYQPDRSRQRVGRQSGGNRACGRGAWGQSHRDRRTRAAGRQLRAADGGLRDHRCLTGPGPPRGESRASDSRRRYPASSTPCSATSTMRSSLRVYPPPRPAITTAHSTSVSSISKS